ncbi:hypothetical protein KR767_08465 [Luteibacter anthropi]|uniref:dermonecrotic toxin domain-containing protein n=1 Tax=Luteibacter anthropi TaxID=564369 RepID=UPI00203277C8|nr:DUF6543 domain-containing protein [Luteibacter anthropi]URX64063.1 hypothetical protein KR767_08465 [Luteibacter anthropi]
MDMAPPQAPPPIVRSSHQEIIDTIGRLAGLHEWIAAQQAQMPLPTDSESKASYLARLDTFWSERPTNREDASQTSRSDAFELHLSRGMRDAATLGRLDGETSQVPGSFLVSLVQQSDTTLPADVQVHELMFGEHPYAGAIVITRTSKASPLYAFTPDRGWEAFVSQQNLFNVIEHRARQRAAAGLNQPGLEDDDFEKLIATRGFVSLRLAGTHPSESLVDRIRALQRARAETAWNDDPGKRIDGMIDALDMHRYFDVGAIFLEREFRQQEAITIKRLAEVPADIASQWRDSRDIYKMEWIHALETRTSQGLSGPLSLAAYASDALKARLHGLGINDDPATIVVELKGTEVPGSAGDLLTDTQDPPLQRLTLIELACANVGFLDFRSARVTTAEGRPLGARLAYRQLRDLIRQLDVGRSYHRYLLQQLRESAPGHLFRAIATRLQQARLRFEAADARLSYYRDAEPRSYIFDREDRGDAWVRSVLSSPGAQGRQPVDGHDIGVHQLTYKGIPLEDILIISAGDGRSAPRIVAYTPDAPDGQAIREFTDRADMASRFLYEPAFEGYLLDRLPVEFTDASSGSRHFRRSAANRQAAWALGQAPGGGARTLTDEAFSESLVTTNVFDVLYDTTVSRLARDATAMTRTTGEADLQATAGLLGLAASGTAAPADALAGTVSALSRGLQALWRTYDDIKTGDMSAAFVAGTEAYTASLAIVGLRALRPTMISKPTIRPSLSHTRLVQAGGVLRHPQARLDPRYRASVDIGGTTADVRGIRSVHGRDYVQQDGAVYEVRYDASYRSWRLTRSGGPDASFTGPQIERIGNRWHMHAGGGLRGGSPAPETAGDRWVSRTDLLPLSPFQQEVFMETLWTRMSSHAEASRIYWDVVGSTGRAIRVTSRQWEVWGQSLDAARQAPYARPPHTPPVLSRLAAEQGNRRVLAPSEWPATVWYYPVEPLPTYPGQRVMFMPQPELTPTGLRGLRTSSQNPVFAGAHAESQPRHGYIGIHLSLIRDQAAGQPRIRVIQERHGTEVNYIVQPATDGHVPVMVLRPGEFSLPAETGPR